MSNGLGLGVAWQQGADYARNSIALLQPAVWYDWRYDSAPDDPRYLPMAFSLQDNAYSRAAMVQAQTDKRLWLLGNEPDAGITYTEPAQAAEFTRLWATEVGGLWAGCGVMIWPVTWRPEMNWMTWLDAFMAAGGAVGSHWHIHIYGVAVPDWYAQVSAFRAWAQTNDVDRPIVVSETAANWAYAPYNVTLLDEIAHRLVIDPALHAVLWYSVHDWFAAWTTTDLRAEDGALTELGQRFVELGKLSKMRQLWLPIVHG